jgi:capsid protein
VSILGDIGRFAKQRVGAWCLGYDAAYPVSSGFPTLNWGEQVPRSEDALVGVWDQRQLRQICKRLYRNCDIVRIGVNRMADHVCGAYGFMPDARTTDQAWNIAAERNWARKARFASDDDRMSDAEISRMLERLYWTDGDAFIVKTADGKRRCYEGENCFTPDDKKTDKTVVNGVKLDANGKPTGYYIHERGTDGSFGGVTKYQFIPAESCHHWFDPYRFAMYRGIPGMAPSVDTMRHISDGTQAVLRKWQQDGILTWLLKTAGGVNKLGGMIGRSEANKPQSTGKPQYIPLDKGGQVLVLDSLNAEGLESFESKTPGQQFEPFVTFNVRKFCALLGLPYEFIMLDASKGNFSQAVFGVPLAKRTLEVRQAHHAKPLTWWWCIQTADAMAAGEIPYAPVDDSGRSQWDEIEWVPPSMEWASPLREASAENMQLASGRKTFGGMARESGERLEDLWMRRGREAALRIKIAKQISAEEGVEVTPDMIATVVVTGGPASATTPATENEEDSDETEEDSDAEQKEPADETTEEAPQDDKKKGGIDKWLM